MSELQQLIENSKANEAIARKFFEIETQILACKSSSELLQQLLQLITDRFTLNSARLLLAQPTPISYLINANFETCWHQAFTYSISSEKLHMLHVDNQAILTDQPETLSGIIPKALLENAGSVALIPLYLEEKLFASLLLIDNDKTRFYQGLGTWHLQQLAVKVSLCLSNVLVREQLEYMAHYDRLTGVANRRLMEESINRELIRQKRYGTPFSIIFIDCNDFKQINDSYGHDCGDQVLTYVATQLSGLIRENDTCFRYAGDEFVIVLANQALAQAQQVSERLQQFFINNAMPYQGRQLNVTISCGAFASTGEQNLTQLLKLADQALYQNKHQYKASQSS